jgi:hypothetical protein
LLLLLRLSTVRRREPIDQPSKQRKKHFGMRLSTALLLLGACSPSFVAAERTEITVDYEYQLEVNGVNRVGTTEDVLGTIDSQIIGALQEALPNGGTSSSEELPNVQYETINSEIFSACFTKSEQCSLVRSSILISYEGEKPEQSVEWVTLRLVQNFLKQYSMQEALVAITYAYPYMVSTLTHFQMDFVRGAMSSTEIEVMRATFLQVFGAIVFAIEGDTEVRDAKFLYQDLFDVRRLQENNIMNTTEVLDGNFTLNGNFTLDGNFTLSMDLQVTGFCRECTSPQFGDVVNNVIIENIEAFGTKLIINSGAVGSSYFDDVTTVSFAVPELPSVLPPMEDDTIFDMEPPYVNTKQPWFLWFGLSMAICIVCIGYCVIWKDRTDLEKDDAFSTSESELESDDSEGEGDGEEEGDGDGDYTNTIGTYDDATYQELDDYQVENITPTEDGSNYEVYVF